MHTRTQIALATILAIGFASHAVAQSIATDASSAVARDVASSASSSRLVASRQPSRSTPMRPPQSRNAGLRSGAPWSGSQAPASEYGGFSSPNNDNNYQYWRQACCQ
jgi:hypothetical protein